MVSTEVLLINKEIPNDKINEMLEKIEKIDGIEWTLGYSKIAENLPKTMIPDDIHKIFENDKYQIIIINSLISVSVLYSCKLPIRRKVWNM